MSDCRICGKSEEEHRIMTQKCSVNHSYCPPFKMLDKETHANFMQKMDDLEAASVLTEGQAGEKDLKYCGQCGIPRTIHEHPTSKFDHNWIPAKAEATHPQDEREAFEEWALTKNRFGGLSLKRNEDGDYFYFEVQDCWESWQARAALASRISK